MRLLKLPAEIQADLSAGRISEGAARAMIPMYDRGEEEQEQLEQLPEDLQPAAILEAAREGMPAEQVNELIQRQQRAISGVPEPPADDPEDPPVSFVTGGRGDQNYRQEALWSIFYFWPLS